MSTFLYRLGRFCARLPWLVLAVWLVVLGGLGAATATWGKPLTSEITIPNADFVDVVETLEEKIPAAAGGIGTVVFTSTTGEFTDEQRAAIDDTLTEWEGMDVVKSAQNPFEVQERLDSSDGKLAEGKQQLAQGSDRIAEARKELGAAEGKLIFGKGALEDMRAADPNGSPEIEALAAQVAEGEEKLEQAREQLAAAEEELASGREAYRLNESLAELSDGLNFVSEDGSVAMTQVMFTEELPSIPPEERHAVMDSADDLAEVGIQADFGTQISQDTSTIIGPGEAIGLAVAGLVLLVMLGSLLAAGLPIANALFGVGAGLAGALALTAFVEMNTITPALALMIGLAVGIDYALFIVNRHRSQLLDGMPVAASIGRANGTAGNAVIVAGATVFIALAALTVTGIPFLGVMGLVAAGTVACTVLVSITLTPALLSLLGMRVLPRRTRRRHGLDARHGADEGSSTPATTRRGAWGRIVTRRPWLVVTAVVALLVTLAWPVQDLRLGLPSGASEPEGSTSRTAYEQIAEHFGEGANGPLLVVGTVDEGASDRELLRSQVDTAQLLGSFDAVESVVAIGTSEDNTTFAFQVIPSEGPSAKSTEQLVHALKDSAAAISDVHLGFAGMTVANIEISEQLASVLPIYLLIVVGLSLLLLTLVFRSLVVPLIATVGFLLSVAASFGAAVAVYQWGWLGDIFGVTTPGPLLSFMPILLIGVLFGLAMDYQMFLVTGMREAWAHGEDARAAVVSGFSAAARVVTAAAIIMISVFAGFIHAELTMIRPIGFGLAAGVLIDAFLIRMTFTPAAMHILGERAWRMPRWLDRILPDLDVEGAGLIEHLEEEQRQAESDGQVRHPAGA